ncbi:hypothetical protein HPULCUR_007794 [Helicostylum pulchrum]|uniref:Uncharacterized protein n=1 Tax=Helicostylum pulchrum TaxID=562976 RepID=A0ABP9Y6G9_9FUNG
MVPGVVVDNTEPMVFPKDREHSSYYDQYIIWYIHSIRRAVDLEDEDVKEILDGSLFDQLKQKTDIQVCNLSTTTLSFFSYNQPRKYQFFAVKKKDQTFDLVERADVNFIETIVLHFVNLALSPRNSLLVEAPERTAAVQTTGIVAIHEILVFWIEIETLVTEKTKWDVGFFPALENKSEWCFSDSQAE